MAVLYAQHFVQFFDDNGDPLSGGKLYTYDAGTTTPKATYTDAAGATPNANPVILDSAGRATVFLSGSYKFRLEDSLGTLIKETDNVTAFSSGDSGVDSITTTFTEDVISTSDSIIFSDYSDGNSTKRDTVQGLVDLTTPLYVPIPNSSTTGDILYHNGTTFARLPVGASGTGLVVSSGVPVWAKGLRLISETVITGSPSSVDMTLPAGYSSFMVEYAGVDIKGQVLQMLVDVGGGFVTSNYNGSIIDQKTTTAYGTTSASAFELLLADSTAAAYGNGYVHIYKGSGGSGIRPFIHGEGWFDENMTTGNAQRKINGFYNVSASVISAVRLKRASGNFSSGVVRLWGA